MPRAPSLLWVLVSAWLGIVGWNVAHEWPGERVSDIHVWWEHRPHDWGQKHPECRQRYGFWPDGTPMEAKQFEHDPSIDEAVEFAVKSRPEYSERRSPEQIARDKWALEVRKKVASCEQAQWEPIVKAGWIRENRITLASSAILPPIIFLLGLGFLARATTNISIVAAKLIATLGAFTVAITVADFIRNISDTFLTFMKGDNLALYRPALLGGPRLATVCAILLPLAIVLWWQRGGAHMRINACCRGIGVGLLPIAIQITTWPIIYHSPDAVWAVAAMALVAAVSLSIFVTMHFLKVSSRTSVVPDNIRKGLVRLYVIVFVPWAAWFGYTAYNAHASFMYDLSQRDCYIKVYSVVQNDDSSPAAINRARSELEVMAVTR
jgi:hypothetical protein